MYDPTEPIVAFYLIHHNAGEPDCPPAKFHALTKALVDGLPANKNAESLSWKVTFERGTTAEALTPLLAFGSDPKCTVVLSSAKVSPFHCIIYAAELWSHNDAPEGVQRRVVNDRLFAEGLQRIYVGPFEFRIKLPLLDAEKMKLSRWFFENEPRPVTKPMLRAQLVGKTAEFEELGGVGAGGNGKVYRFVEKRTGLLFGVKKQPEHLNSDAKKESLWMKYLQSPLLAQYIHSELLREGSVVEWWTYIPLYRGNLTAMLPQPVEILDNVMLQMLKAVSFIHEKGALHQDIKPDIFFVLKKRPIGVVLGDLGHTISMQDDSLLTADCGTDGFAAPERLKQRHTTALDVYSLGVSFFIMLEYERLRHQDWKRAFQKMTENPPSAYGGLVMRMTLQKPEERPTLHQCIEVVVGKDYNWGKQRLDLGQPVRCSEGCLVRNAQQNPSGSGRVLMKDIGRKAGVEKIDAPGVVTADPSKKRLKHPIKDKAYQNTFPRRGINAWDDAPVLANNTSLFRPGAFERVFDQPAEVTTRYNILEDLRRKNDAASPRPINLTREPKAKDVNHNVFAPINTNEKTAPAPQITKKQNHKENPTTHRNIFAHLVTTTKTPAAAPKDDLHENKIIPVRPQTQHSQPSTRTVRPKRTSTRTLLRRSPIRKANIHRAFVIGQRLNRICSTATDIAKHLYYLGVGVVTNTCDIALLGVDAFKLFKDVRRARQVIEHAESVKMSDGLRIAAGLRSNELRFVTPTEYERERTASVQLKREPEKSKMASQQLGGAETVREERTERRAGESC